MQAKVIFTASPGIVMSSYHTCSTLLALSVLQVLAPGLRMGWATAAPGLLEKLIFQLHGSLLGPTSLSQARCPVALPWRILPSALPQAASQHAAACPLSWGLCPKMHMTPPIALLLYSCCHGVRRALCVLRQETGPAPAGCTLASLSLSARQQCSRSWQAGCRHA